MENITLYLPCYNVAHFLDKVIPAIMEQTYPITEVLIIDDGSKDNTLEVAQKYVENSTYPLRIVKQEQNKGLSEARNRGIQEAKTEFVASIDADCIANKFWLAKLMQHFTNDKIAGVGGKLIETQFFELADEWRDAHMRQDWGGKVEENPSFLYGHGNVFRRNVMLEVGGYDKIYKTNAEDYHFSQAIYRKGYKLMYEPEAILHHLKTDTTESVLRAYWRYHKEWQLKPKVEYIREEAKKTKFRKFGKPILNLWLFRHFLKIMLNRTRSHWKTRKELILKDKEKQRNKLIKLDKKLFYKFIRLDIKTIKTTK